MYQHLPELCFSMIKRVERISSWGTLLLQHDAFFYFYEDRGRTTGHCVREGGAENHLFSHGNIKLYEVSMVAMLVFVGSNILVESYP